MTPYYADDLVTIYHGDAFDVLPELSDVAALITDPPYSSGGQFRGDRMQNVISKYVQTGTIIDRAEFTGDNRDQRSYLAWCSLWLTAARHAALPGCVVAMFTDWRQLPITTDALQAGGWVWRGIGVWDKTNAARGLSRWLAAGISSPLGAAIGAGRMTDPRIAALAEALTHIGVAAENVASMGTADQWVPDTEAARTLLRWLPPDWCGHEQRESVRDSLERLGLPQRKGRIPPDVVHPAPFADDNLYADLARLREIEEAARDVADLSPLDTDPEGLGGDWCHYCQESAGYTSKSESYAKHEAGCSFLALRAALEAK